jgi:hypothetical protein
LVPATSRRGRRCVAELQKEEKEKLKYKEDELQKEKFRKVVVFETAFTNKLNLIKFGE